MKIKRFFEFLSKNFDYDEIFRLLGKTHGWGVGSFQEIENFENDDEYYKDPTDENDYVEQFHIYLTDKETNRMRGKSHRNDSLRVGKWQHGVQVLYPISIHNKLT